MRTLESKLPPAQLLVFVKAAIVAAFDKYHTKELSAPIIFSLCCIQDWHLFEKYLKILFKGGWFLMCSSSGERVITLHVNAIDHFRKARYDSN